MACYTYHNDNSGKRETPKAKAAKKKQNVKPLFTGDLVHWSQHPNNGGPGGREQTQKAQATFGEQHSLSCF